MNLNYGGSVYIMANKYNTVLYIGSSSELLFRVIEHRERAYPTSFTAKYNCDKLVYYEDHDCIEAAHTRERQLKKWKRKWKDELITKFNPEWRDLFDTLS